MISEIPDWAQDSIVGELEPTPSRAMKSQTDAERIAIAKVRAMKLCKDSNPVGGEYGFGYPPAYFQDFAGSETSAYAFNHLLFLLYFLQEPQLGTAWLNEKANYDSRTGIWTHGGSHIPIADLKAAVAERIAELSISEVRLLEYLAAPHSVAESQARLSFEESMARFRR